MGGIVGPWPGIPPRKPDGQLGRVNIINEQGRVIQQFIGNRKDRRKFLQDVQRNQRRLSRRATGNTG